MIISIGCDHGGFAMKERIVELLKGINIQVIDQGCYSDESVSYPMFAHKVTNDIQNQKADFGVLICKTGVGMSIAANKQKGIRAALVSDKEVAMLARKHNDANVICFGANYITFDNALECLLTFINESFEGGRHISRIKLLESDQE
ncbi:MAG: ribose 5-phosphate isomerase B [Bacilli bacterium]|jgi:ribose 5-phosphate isomerase B